MISAFQNSRFRCCRQGIRKTAQKVRRRGIARLLDEDDSQTQKQIVEQLSVSQQTVSNRLRDGKDSESRQMGAT